MCYSKLQTLNKSSRNDAFKHLSFLTLKCEWMMDDGRRAMDVLFSLVMVSFIVCSHKFSCHFVFVSIFYIIYEIQPFFSFIWRYNQITLKCISLHTRKTKNINMKKSLNYVRSFLQWLLCDVYIILCVDRSEDRDEK